MAPWKGVLVPLVPLLDSILSTDLVGDLWSETSVKKCFGWPSWNKRVCSCWLAQVARTEAAKATMYYRGVVLPVVQVPPFKVPSRMGIEIASNVYPLMLQLNFWLGLDLYQVGNSWHSWACRSLLRTVRYFSTFHNKTLKNPQCLSRLLGLTTFYFSSLTTRRRVHVRVLFIFLWITKIFYSYYKK